VEAVQRIQAGQRRLKAHSLLGVNLLILKHLQDLTSCSLSVKDF